MKRKTNANNQGKQKNHVQAKKYIKVQRCNIIRQPPYNIAHILQKGKIQKQTNTEETFCAKTQLKLC